MSGIMSVTGAPDGQPQKVGIAVTDILTGLYSVNAILAALHLAGPDGARAAYRHGPAGRGHGLHGEPGDELPDDRVAPERIGNAHQNLTPYQVFDCADGWIIIATGNDAQYQRLCALLGLEEMATAPEYLTNADRIANRDEMTRRLTEATLQRSKAELAGRLRGQGVPAGPINDLAEVFADPQVIARGMRRETDGVPGVRPPFRFSHADVAPHQPAPKLGMRTTTDRLVRR
jgi:crotonobetainyl-CoA:carnitine CoA-transferase CaiB-like acyl-CoA transferase